MQSINIDKIKKLDTLVNEAYKRLRTNVELCGEDIKIISVTSNIPNEGKSSVAFNLAKSLAEAGKKVIFVDCDMRKSVLIGRYKVNKGVKGLSQYLSGLNDYEDVVYATNVENLHVIFSGPVPPNPAELLGANKFKSMLRKQKSVYDYIILDTPPIGSVVDGVITAQNSDGAIFVIQHGEISHKFAKNTKAQLEKCNCKILGAVLNKVPTGDNGYYGKYYGKYYGNYGSYGSYGNENE